MAQATTKKGSASYTDPELREKIKDKIKRGSRGGAAGQWSARKAQLLATEYREAGGGYRGGKKSTQKSLSRWTKEDWQTGDGSARARGGGRTKRYLPKKAWEKLSPAEKRATETKKAEGSRAGKQFVGNTGPAKAARKKATAKKAATKATAHKKAAARKATTSKKTTAKKRARKATATKKAAAKRAARGEATAKKAATKKATRNRATAKRTATKKATRKKTTAKGMRAK